MPGSIQGYITSNYETPKPYLYRKTPTPNNVRGASHGLGCWSRALRGLRTFARRNPCLLSGVCGALIILVAILAPLIAPYDPLKANFRRMAKAPDAENYFGTDQIGRDNLSRIIYGARASLVVAIAAVLLGTTTGSLWGLASGYIGGSFDIVSQRIIEFLQAFPDLILAMAISMALGTGHGTVIVAIAITRIPFGGRIVRAIALSLKEMAYVEAARAIGSSPLRIMARHIYPSVWLRILSSPQRIWALPSSLRQL